MAVYKNITTTGSSTTLIEKSSGIGGGINKITISNNSDNPATVIVDLWDGVSDAPFYICKNVIIPTGAVLLLEDNISFRVKDYKLRINNTGTNPDLTIMIK